MHEVLSRNVYLVKEHVGLFKAANNYDIYDPDTGGIIMECREERLGIFTKLLRFSDYKRMTPFDIQIRTPAGQQVVRVKRGVSFFLSKVEVLDESDRVIGGFKQKLFSIGGAFTVHESQGTPRCQLKGKWKGWDFRFMTGDTGSEPATKQWTGIGKELVSHAA